MVEVTMPEAKPAPIAAPVSAEARPGAEPVKSLPDLQKPFDSMFAGVLPAARDATILKQTPQPYEIDQRLAAVSDPNKKKQLVEALASAGEKAVKAVETQENFDKAVAAGSAEKDTHGYTGKFTLKTTAKDAAGNEVMLSETSGHAPDAYTDAIRGVKSVIAETEGSTDPKQQELNTKAKEAFDGMRSNVRVDIATEKDIPLEVWEQRVNQKAFELWKADNPAGTEAEYVDPAKVSPLAKHAYQLRAETELDPQAKYKLVYAEKPPEAPSPQTQESETILEERTNNALDATNAILRADIDDHVGEDPTKIEFDPELAEVAFWNARLADGSGDLDFISSLATRAVQNYLQQHSGFEGRHADLHEVLGRLRRNSNYYDQPKNDPARTYARDTLVRVLDMEVPSADAIVDNTNLGNVLTFIGTLDKGIKPEDLEKVFKTTKILSATDVRLARRLLHGTKLEELKENFAEKIGLNAKEFQRNARDFLVSQAAKVVENLGYTPGEKNKAAEIYRQRVKLDDKAMGKIKEKLTLGQWAARGLMGAMGLGMLLSMIQGSLNFGLVTDDEQRG